GAGEDGVWVVGGGWELRGWGGGVWGRGGGGGPPWPCGPNPPDWRRNAPAAPKTAASGVRRSCEIEVKSAERNRSASVARLARSRSSTRRTRSMASAA